MKRMPWPILCLVLGAAPLLAAPLTWEDCVRELGANNPEIKAAQAAVEKARNSYRGNIGAFLPQISAAAAARHSNTELDTGYSDSTSYSADLSAQQSLFAGFRDEATLKQSRALLAAAEMNLQRIKANLSYSLRSAFSQWLYARDYLKLTGTIAARRKENVNLVELRFDAGRENKGAYLRSLAFLHQAEFEVSQARRALKTAQRQLAAVLGREPGSRRDGNDDVLELDGAWTITPPPAPAPAFADLIQLTPDHRQAVAQRDAAREGVRIARSNFYPEWTASAMVGRNDDDSWIPDNDQWGVSTALSFPIFAGGSHLYSLRGAQADRLAAQATLANTDNQLAAGLDEKFAAWQDGVERVTVQDEFLKAAKVRAEIGRGQYTNGLLSFEDWDIIENDLIDKEKTLLGSQRDAVIAQANWEKIIGSGVIP